ncbi:GntR family transcriptional regulator, partial [Streptomyces africanus]|uniref:GntR family transcriptional regulator n=1 Tax=Streptomyces africanus TaxID=231024 RepID=UPI001FCA3E20
RYEIEADELRRRIRDGEFAVGATLPRVNELAEQRGVSPQTIRNAFAELEREGLVRVVRGTGAIVQPAAPPRRRIRRGVLVTRDPKRGYIFPAAANPNEPWDTHSAVKTVLKAPAEVAERFGLEPGTGVLRRRRITSPAGQAPFQIVDTWISPQAVASAPQAGEANTGPGGYLDRLEFDGNHGPVSWTETTRVRMPSKEEAKLLKISTSQPVFELTLEEKSARTGEPVAVTVRVIPGDRVELCTELIRGESAAWPVDPVTPA